MKYYTYAVHDAILDSEYISEIEEDENGVVYTNNSHVWSDYRKEWIKDEWMDSMFDDWDHLKSTVHFIRELNDDELEKYLYAQIK